MATTTGLVQRLTILSGGIACAWIGPSPTNTAILLVLSSNSDTAPITAFKTSMVDTLSAAMMARREVTASHDDNDSKITWLSINAVA